jgi:putative endonuclease
MSCDRYARRIWITRVVPYFHPMRRGWVYIMTNKPNGTIYLGVTANLLQRVCQHREGIIDGFTKRYGLKLLVYAEQHDDIRSAIQRERTMKHWPRAWKINLIIGQNPNWQDLADTL